MKVVYLVIIVFSPTHREVEGVYAEEIKAREVAEEYNLRGMVDASISCRTVK